MNVVVIIQARMGSTRLPGKVLMPLMGKPSIQHVIERAKLIPDISKVVIATSKLPKDDQLVEVCESIDVSVFRGSENDVLNRYYQAALFYKASVVVRITGDCPLIDPIESGKVVRKLLNGGADYVSNVFPPKLPDGLDTEAFTIDTLKKTWKNATKKADREHVSRYIRSNPKKFKIESISYEVDFGIYRLTLDEMDDYELLKKVFDILEKNNQFGYLNEVVSILKKNPDLMSINSKYKRNEGLHTSLRKDSLI
jgi:spore coat polysaccharide biosynthesis protein SpsF